MTYNPRTKQYTESKVKYFWYHRSILWCTSNRRVEKYRQGRLPSLSNRIRNITKLKLVYRNVPTKLPALSIHLSWHSWRKKKYSKNPFTRGLRQLSLARLPRRRSSTKQNTTIIRVWKIWDGGTWKQKYSVRGCRRTQKTCERMTKSKGSGRKLGVSNPSQEFRVSYSKNTKTRLTINAKKYWNWRSNAQRQWNRFVL